MQLDAVYDGCDTLASVGPVKVASGKSHRASLQSQGCVAFHQVDVKQVQREPKHCVLDILDGGTRSVLF